MVFSCLFLLIMVPGYKVRFYHVGPLPDLKSLQFKQKLLVMAENVHVLPWSLEHHECQTERQLLSLRKIQVILFIMLSNFITYIYII